MPRPSLTPQQFQEARVTHWDTRKGFGYLGEGRDQIFLHRRDFVRWQGPPAVGDRIRFIAGTADRLLADCRTLPIGCLRFSPPLEIFPHGLDADYQGHRQLMG